MPILNGAFHWDAPPAASGNLIHASFTGRLDNKRGLLEQFKTAGVPPVEQDEEFILKAYQLWGLSFPSCLRGDFAIAIWDSRKKQGLLARDPLGLKPLYYFQDSRKILFSSRIRSLFNDPSVPQKPDSRMLGHYFTGEFLDYESTFFDRIQQVPPAHLLVFKNGSPAEKRRYWSPDTIKPRIYRDKNQYLEEFYALFETSVRGRMADSSATGLLLSGGLDSAQICAMAETLRLGDKSLPPLKSVCLLVEGFLAEEKTAVDRLREHYHSDIEIMDYTAVQKSESLFEFYLDPGEIPHYDPFLVRPPLLENLAARGCKTLLTGYGANEFSNLMEFGYLEDLALSFRLGELSREAKRFAKSIHTSGRQAMQIILLEVMREKAPLFVRRLIRRKRLHDRKWLRPEFRKTISPCPPPRLRPFGRLAQDEAYHALFEPQIPLALAQMEEAAGRYGMEISHPFLDLPLIEFFLSIPPEIKMEGGYRKNFIQRSLARIMPFPIREEDDERSYIPFPDLQSRKTLEISRLQRYLSDPGNLIYDAYADYAGVQTLLNPAAASLNIPLLWRLVRLEHWLRAFWGKSVFINDFEHSRRYNFAHQVT